MKVKQSALQLVAEPVAARIVELGMKALLAELRVAKELPQDIDSLCASLDRACQSLDSIQETIATWTYGMLDACCSQS